MISLIIAGILSAHSSAELNKCKVAMDTSMPGISLKNLKCQNGEIFVTKTSTPDGSTSIDSLKIFKKSDYITVRIRSVYNQIAGNTTLKTFDTTTIDAGDGAIFRKGYSFSVTPVLSSPIENRWSDTVRVWDNIVDIKGKYNNSPSAARFWGDGFVGSGKSINNEVTYKYENTVGNLVIIKERNTEKVRQECYVGSTKCENPTFK